MTNISTPAIIEFQKLSLLINRRLEADKSVENSRFWLKQYHLRGTEIATRYSVTLDDLVDAWVGWTLAVNANRQSEKAGA